MDKKKWLTGGLSLALVMGGAIYAYADDTQAASTAPSDQAQVQPAPKAEHKKDWKKEHDGQSLQKLATILGMKPDEIKAGLKSGKSIVDLAQAKGIPEADLINKLVANAAERIDAAVKAGKMTQQKADQIKQNLPARIKKMVERKGLPDGKHGKHGKHGMVSFRPGLDKIAGWLSMTPVQVRAEIKAGKSLAAIASEHGMTKDQLIAKIKEDMTPAIDKFVTRTHLEGKGGKADSAGAMMSNPASTDGGAS